MEIKLNLKTKTIILLESISVEELLEIAKTVFPTADMKDIKIISEVKIEYIQPITYPNPWITTDPYKNPWDRVIYCTTPSPYNFTTNSNEGEINITNT